LARRAASGANTPVTALIHNWLALDWLDALAPVMAAGKSVLVVAASAAEVGVLREATKGWGKSVAAIAGEDDASDTRAWEAAQAPPRLVLGTPKSANWRVAGLALAIVLEENRRSMKDRQTPTLHVRDVLRTRSRIEGFNLVFFGPTPGVELLAGGAEVVSVGQRAWPLVEVIDRSDEPPGSGFVSGRVMAALKATAEGGKRAFVFTHRRIGQASTRCASCRALRSCAACGRRMARGDVCVGCGTRAEGCVNCGGLQFEEMGSIPDRLVAEIARALGTGVVGTHPGNTPITVGTERDLAGMDRVSLAVAADVDGMLTVAGYRAAEDALRQLARLATMITPGRGARLMMQTSRPDSLLVTTMRRGDPIPYLERVLVERARDGSPPSTEMIAIEIRGDVPDDAATELGALPGAIVFGPMPVEDGFRWLLTGRLGEARLGLRRLVGRWRDRGATVRVDADPIDV
jgi:primosomal protein N'